MDGYTEPAGAAPLLSGVIVGAGVGATVGDGTGALSFS
jgi:hypothetical protein